MGRFLDDLGCALRSARDADESFLARLFESTAPVGLAHLPMPPGGHEQLLAMMRRGQRETWRATWPDAEPQVVERGAEPIGRLWCADEGHALRVVDIAVLPEHRGQGIGRALLLDLQQEARTRGCDVVLSAQPGNPALRLYERLGFRDGGGDELHREMRWSPAGANAESEEVDPVSAELRGWQGLLGTSFALVVEGDPAELALVEASGLSQADDTPRRAPFSLVFEGPSTPALPQGSYRLHHAERGDVEIFLVPVEPDGSSRRRYEAVFA